MPGRFFLSSQEVALTEPRGHESSGPVAAGVARGMLVDGSMGRCRWIGTVGILLAASSLLPALAALPGGRGSPAPVPIPVADQQRRLLPGEKVELMFQVPR